MKAINSHIFIFLLFSSIISFAQADENNNYISKGQWMLGGTMSLSTTDDFIRTPSFSISPMAGYFIGNRWAIGLDLGYSFNKVYFLDPYGAERSHTYNNFSADAFTRYYFGVGKFAPFAEAGYGMNWRYSDVNDLSKSRYESPFKIGVGLNYFVSPSLAVEGKLLYARSKEDLANNPISLGIGLQFFLSRNQKATVKETDPVFLKKGSWMVGGNINVSLGNIPYSDYLSQDHRISPMAGYFLSDKLAVGLAMYYSYLTMYDELYIESLSAAPFVRYYFGTKRFAPFAEAAFGGGLTEVGSIEGTGPQTVKDENFSYQAAAGFDYFITNNVALETKLSYLRDNNIDQGSLRLQAGVSFFLSRKK